MDRPDVVILHVTEFVCVMPSNLCPQLEVHEAKAMLDNHPQWDIPDTEEEDDEQEDSDGIEESEDDDEDNDWMWTPDPPTRFWPHSSTQE